MLAGNHKREERSSKLQIAIIVTDIFLQILHTLHAESGVKDWGVYFPSVPRKQARREILLELSRPTCSG